FATRSTRRTASTARPATSRTPTRTSTGSPQRAAADPTTAACEAGARGGKERPVAVGWQRRRSRMPTRSPVALLTVILGLAPRIAHRLATRPFVSIHSPGLALRRPLLRRPHPILGPSPRMTEERAAGPSKLAPPPAPPTMAPRACCLNEEELEAVLAEVAFVH